jgi:hypothetical protein
MRYRELRHWHEERTMRAAHQGFDLQLTRYDERVLRTTFYTIGMEHSPTSATGTDWERAPWHPVQGAVRDALPRAEANNTKCLTE